MNIFKTVIVGMMCVLTLSACKKSNTYADYKETEDEAIAAYLDNHNIIVTKAEPQSDEEWLEDGREVYCTYNSSKMDGLYFHLCERGEGRTPEVNWTAYVRYIGTNTKGSEYYNCTASYSPDPLSFVVRDNAVGERYGSGFQEAVKKLKVGGHCKVIIPFSLGNSSLTTVSGGVFSDRANYQTMCYEIWLVAVE